MSLSNKTPQFNGSMDYLERCGDLIRAYHNSMVSKQFSSAIAILQEVHSELLPWMDEKEAKACGEYEKKGINQLQTVSGVKISINIKVIHNWFRKLNIIFHNTGLAMKANKVEDDVWEL